MATFVNRAKVATSTTGTGTITLGAAEDGYQTFAAAGVADGNTVRYTIEDGNNWEIGTGTYTATGTTLSRSPSESSNAGAAINLSGNAIVFVTALATDFTSPTYTNLTATGTVDFTGATVSDLGTVTTANIDGGDIASAVTINKSPTVTLTGAITGSGTLTNLGNVSIATTATSDPTLTMAGDITGSATFTNLGNATLTATVVGGDVDTAAAWTTARTLSLTGAVTGSVLIDGSANASIATTATSDPTLTLAGDATGSATFTNLGNATLTVTVVDDSHNHIISNVDGLQTALDGKLSTSGKAADSELLDGLDSTAFLRSNASDTMDAGTNTTLTILSDDTGASTIQLYGASQGTGRVYVGQDASYGGGIEYNGDGSPSTTGAGADYITLYRREVGTDSWTARNYYNSNNWEFRGNLYANTNQRVFADDYHPNADKWTTARTLSLTGAVTGSASIDGSGNVSLATTATSDPTLTLSGDATGSATFTNLGNATLSVTVVNDSHTHAFNNLTSKTGGTGTYYTNGTMAGATLQGGTNTALTGVGQVGLFGPDPYISFHPGSSVGRYGYLQKINAGGHFLFGEQSYVLSPTSFRAPVFYDSDNTGYYVDPSSSSSLNVAAANRFYSGYDSGLTGAMSCNNWFRSNGATGWYNATYAGGIYMQDSTYVRVFGSKVFYADNYILSGGSVRGTIFYDSNNTAYYFDGSATGDSIRVAGDIVAYYSDERLKTNLGNIESPVDKVKQLNGFKYHANELGAKHGYDPEKIQVGVSAQEVEAVLPEVVRDAPIGHGYKTVQYERLVPLLIEAIKEQAGQIEALQAEVAALKG